MGSDLAMRMRTLIELLAALILTFAALAAVSKTVRTTGMKVEKAYAFATIGETVPLQRTLPEAQPVLIHHIRTYDGKPLRTSMGIRIEATKFAWQCMIDTTFRARS